MWRCARNSDATTIDLLEVVGDMGHRGQTTPSVNNSGKAQFEVHLVVYAKNKCARVFHSPTYVRHYELCARGDPAVPQVYLSVERHPMILPVNPQDAMHVNLAFTLHRDLTGNVVRRKNRFGKSIPFQYGFMQQPIT